MHTTILTSLVPALCVLFGLDFVTSSLPTSRKDRFYTGIVLIVVGVIVSVTS